MSPEAAAIFMIPAHVFKWVGFAGGVVALVCLLTLVHALCVAGKQTDREMEEEGR